MNIHKNIKLSLAVTFCCVLILLSCEQPQLPTVTNSKLPASVVTQTVVSDSPDTDGLVQTAQLFADGLRMNDDKLLKTIVLKESWAYIDTWLANHKPISCGFSLKRLLEQPNLTIISSPLPDRTNIWRVNVVWVFPCPTNKGSSYSLVINQALVKYTGQKWLVVEWQGVNETNE